MGETETLASILHRHRLLRSSKHPRSFLFPFWFISHLSTFLFHVSAPILFRITYPFLFVTCVSFLYDFSYMVSSAHFRICLHHLLTFLHASFRISSHSPQSFFRLFLVHRHLHRKINVSTGLHTDTKVISVLLSWDI